MNGPEPLGYFFGNLERLLGAARLTPRQLSEAIGREPDHVAEMIRWRMSPGLEMVYAMADALKVDPADLVRPTVPFGFTTESARDWAEKVAERVLAGTLDDGWLPIDEVPTIDEVLSWWHANDGLLTATERLDAHVDIFDRPDIVKMCPVPVRMGEQSLIARELKISTPEQLGQVLERSGLAIRRRIAMAHADVVGRRPMLSMHSLLIDLFSGRLVKLSYVRLLLPVRDSEGRHFVMNYSKPFRRDEIVGEETGDFERDRRRQPVLAGLD